MKQGAAMRGGSIVYYHQSWVYFAERFGLTVAAYVESKPGIAPSAAHRARVVDVVGAADVPIIVVTNYYDARLPRAIAEQTGIRFASVPLMTGGSAEASTWFDLMDHLVGTISAAYEAGR